jgi:hypothetical protein
MDKKSGSGSGMNNSDHISERLETIFGIRYGKNSDPDGKNSSPGSGINIPDPHYCILSLIGGGS